MNSVCRVCIEKLTRCTPLSSEIEDSSNLSFFDFLNKFTTLNAREDDGLPRWICIVCDNAMRMFYSFMKQAEKSDLILREALKRLAAEGRYNGHKETLCEESAKRKEIAQPSENSTGSSLYILDFLKKEPPPSESTSIVAEKQAVITESEHLESNLNHPEKSKEEPDDVISRRDRPLASIITAELTDFENEIPTSSLKRKLAKSEDEADSRRNFYEEITIKNETIGEESEDSNHGDSFHWQPSKNSTESLPYILDIVKEEPRVSESTNLQSNLDNSKESIEELDDILSCIDSRPASIDTEHTDSEDDSPITLLKKREKSFVKESSGSNDSCYNGVYDKKNKFECEICGKKFTKNYLERYHMECHRETKSKCNQCGKEFMHRYNLNRHMKWHINPKSCNCEICGKSLSSKESYARHMATLHPEQSEKSKSDCGICGKSFNIKYFFDVHMEKHKGIKQKCDKCGKEFTQGHNLNRHMKCHSNPNPFKCEKCGRLFDRRYRYSSHIKVCEPAVKREQLETEVVISHESAPNIA